MVRQSFLRSLMLLAVALVLGMGTAFPVWAQDEDPTPGEESPPVEQPSEPQSGMLAISAVSCSGSDAGTVSIVLAADYVPTGDCVDGASALLIDGVDHGAVAPYLEVPLEAGAHSLSEPNSGATRSIEIVPDGVTSVIIVTAIAAEPTEEPVVEAAAVTTGELIIVAHACEPAVQSVDQLFSLGDRTARLNACPAMTLPGYSAPGGTVGGGERWFDFTLSPASGDPKSLSGNGTFVPDAFCESEVGPLDNDPTNDRCVSTSGFAFELPEGAVSLVQAAIPDGMRYVAAESGSDADAGIITESDPGSGYLALDTSMRGTDRPVVHLYYLNPPRVNIVMHLCGPEIASTGDLDALGSLAARLVTCPATARAAEGGAVDFAVTVTDNNWGARGLDASWFDPTLVCESDIGDWDGDGSDNLCLDAPTYRFDQTAMGWVTVAQDYVPDGFTFGGADSDLPGVIVSVDPGTGVVSLDTSVSGDVTIHLFDLVAAPLPTETPAATATAKPSNTPVPPTPTATAKPSNTAVPPTATRTQPFPSATAFPTVSATATAAGVTRTATPPASTPTTIVPSNTPTATVPAATSTATTAPATGNGTLIVAALYCLSGSSTSVVALPPGQQASAADLGGSGCFAGDATITLTLADGSSIPALKLGRDGVESIQNIPVTAADAHTVTEGLTGRNANFEIAPGTITRVIIRYGAGTGMVDEGVLSTGGAPGSTTGTGSKPGATAGGGLVTDELIGDAGVSSSAGSYSGISFTSLVVEDVDAQAISSIKDAKSLPAVGAHPGRTVSGSLGLMVALGLLLLSGSVALASRRSARRTQ